MFLLEPHDENNDLNLKVGFQLAYVFCDFLTHILQVGIVTDGDGPYQPGITDCTWTIAPQEATALYLTFSKLSLGGTTGDNQEQLEIMACESLACKSPIHIPGSPFSERSDILW